MQLPHAITRRDEGLLVTWSEGESSLLAGARSLRLACPCAACHDELTGAPLLDPNRVADDIRPVSLALVGAYGLRVTWSDGHDTGIYTFEALRKATDAEGTRDR